MHSLPLRIMIWNVDYVIFLGEVLGGGSRNLLDRVTADGVDMMSIPTVWTLPITVGVGGTACVIMEWADSQLCIISFSFFFNEFANGPFSIGYN